MLKDIGWKTNLYIYIFKYHIAFNAQKREKSTRLFVYIFIFKYFRPNKYLPFYIHPSNKNDMTGKEKSTVWHRLMRHRRTKTAQNDCPSDPLLSANTIHSGPTVLVGPLNVCNSHTNGAWHRIVRRNSSILRLSLVLRRSATIVGTTAKEAAKQMEKGKTAGAHPQATGGRNVTEKTAIAPTSAAWWHTNIDRKRLMKLANENFNHRKSKGLSG